MWELDFYLPHLISFTLFIVGREVVETHLTQPSCVLLRVIWEVLLIIIIPSFVLLSHGIIVQGLDVGAKDRQTWKNHENGMKVNSTISRVWLSSGPVSESVFLGLYLQRDAAGREKDRVVSQAADDGTLLYSLLLGFRFRFFVLRRRGW